MKRRDFVRNGTIGSAALIALGPRSAIRRTDDEAVFDLEEVTINQLQRDMAERRRTARSITQQYIERIDSLDKRGPELRHVLEINPDALSIADALDRERAAGRVRGALHGIPILLKDNIDTADRMTTTAGSLALEGSIPLRDAFIAKQLRDAGAILLGKTNMSEWAKIRSTQ
jgi:amidase